MNQPDDESTLGARGEGIVQFNRANQREPLSYNVLPIPNRRLFLVHAEFYRFFAVDYNNPVVPVNKYALLPQKEADFP